MKNKKKLRKKRQQTQKNSPQKKSSQQHVGMQFEVYKKDQVDKQFAKILKSIKSTDSHFDIISKISQGLGNRMLLAENFKPSDPVKTIYRVTDHYQGMKPDLKSAYSYPPAEICKRGRANLEGFPVFYGALDFFTAVKEMKEKIKPGKVFYLSKWDLNLKETISAHTLILNSRTDDSGNKNLFPIAQHQKDILKAAFKVKLEQEFEDGLFAGLKGMGDLFASKSDSTYHISSAYGHFILYRTREQTPRAIIPIIVYPTVENASSSLNYAIHPSLVEDEVLQLKYVYKVLITESLKDDGSDSFSVLERGIPQKDNTIQWQVPDLTITKIEFDGLELITLNGHQLSGQDACSRKIVNSNHTVKSLVELVLSEEKQWQLMSNLFDKIKKVNVFELEEGLCDAGFILPFALGHLIETPTGNSDIHLIKVSIEWKKGYKSLVTHPI
jgi:hypothetical protein